jgi:hypothetical protein
LAFLGRVDGRGDFALVETEDVASIARDGGSSNVFFDFNVYPFMSPPGSLAKRSSSVAALDSALCKISQLHR